MNKNELHDQVIAGAWPKVHQLMEDMWVQSGNPDISTPLPLDTESLAMIKEIWAGIMQNVELELLWSVAALATNGTFVGNDANIAAAVAAIDLDVLMRDIGLDRKDTIFVLKQMAESLAEVIRQHSPIDVEIDRKPVRLRAMKKQSIFSRIFKFIF